MNMKEIRMLDNTGGRKMIAAVMILVLTAVIVIIKGDITPNIVSMLEFLFGALVAGNAVEHVSGAVSARAASKSEVKAPEPEAPTDYTADFQQLSAQLSGLESNDHALAQNISLIQQTLSVIITRTGIDKMPDPKV
jgi:hypothetical protein